MCLRRGASSMRILNLDSLDVSPCPHRERGMRKRKSSHLQNVLEVELLDLAFEAARQARVHRGAARNNNVLVELGAQIDVGSLCECQR